MTDDDWYNTDWSADPKADFIFDLAIDEGMWDGSVTLGACDLIWCPGWLLRDGAWPSAGYSFWPHKQPDPYWREDR